MKSQNKTINHYKQLKHQATHEKNVIATLLILIFIFSVVFTLSN